MRTGSREPHDAETDGDVVKNQAVIELDVEAWEVSGYFTSFRRSEASSKRDERS